MNTVHYTLPIDQTSYDTLAKARAARRLVRRPLQRLQHDQPPGTLYRLSRAPLTALDDGTVQVGDLLLSVPLYRLPTAEHAAVIQSSPHYSQYQGLHELSRLLRDPSTTLTAAQSAITTVTRNGRQPTRLISLAELDPMFRAQWRTDEVVLQNIGEHWFLVLFFDLCCVQPAAITRATEFALDLGAHPLVYACTADDERFVTADCTLPTGLRGLRRQFDDPDPKRVPERDLLDQIVTAWHRRELQRVTDRLCREASIIYAEDLTYSEMFGRFVAQARRYGVIDFHESWLHNRLQACGIPLEKVDPSGTSQRCARCTGQPYGYRHGDRFTCHCCGRTMNAHWNACWNIMRLGREKAQRWGTAV